jgi:hypothetical protein
MSFISFSIHFRILNEFLLKQKIGKGRKSMNSVGLLSTQGLAMVHSPRAQNGSTGPCHQHRAPGSHSGAAGRVCRRQDRGEIFIHSSQGRAGSQSGNVAVVGAHRGGVAAAEQLGKAVFSRRQRHRLPAGPTTEWTKVGCEEMVESEKNRSECSSH